MSGPWAEFHLPDGDLLHRVIFRWDPSAKLDVDGGVVEHPSSGGEWRLIHPAGSKRAALVRKTGHDEFAVLPVDVDDEVTVKAGEVRP